MTNIETLSRAIMAGSNKDRSKWAKGVRRYAAEMVDQLNEWGEDIRDIYHAIDRTAPRTGSNTPVAVVASR